MKEYDPYYTDARSGELQKQSIQLARSVRALGHRLRGCVWVDRKPVDQMCRAGTSIGANIREARFSESNKDFLHKLKIAEKELGELFYWLGVLSSEPRLIDPEQADNLFERSMNVRNLLLSAILTMKRKIGASACQNS